MYRLSKYISSTDPTIHLIYTLENLADYNLNNGLYFIPQAMIYEAITDIDIGYNMLHYQGWRNQDILNIIYFGHFHTFYSSILSYLFTLDIYII